MQAPSTAQWRYVLGAELLAWLLGCDVSGLDAPVTDERQRVLLWLDDHLDSLLAVDPRLPMALVRGEVDGESIARWLRARSGTVDDVRVEGVDEPERLLRRVADAAYPLLLADEGLVVPAGPNRALPMASARTMLVQFLGDRPEATTLDQELAELRRAAGHRWLSTVSMTVQLASAMMTESLLEAASNRLRHAERPSASQFADAAVDCLRELTRAVAGSIVEVRTLVGISGLDVGAERLDTANGVLRPTTAGERRFAPFMQLADSVLEIETPALVHEQQQRPVEVGAGHSVGTVGREVCLATALAGQAERWDKPSSVPSIAWVTSLPPISATSNWRPLHPEKPRPASPPFDASQRRALQTWVAHVSSADLAHVEVGVDRLLRSLWQSEPTESLIDSVIAWENFLGTRTETVFRVTAAIAVLTEADIEERFALRKRLAKVYDIRSRIVHGDDIDTSVLELRTTAGSVGLEVLGALITRRTDLLERARSSDRADRLLMGA